MGPVYIDDIVEKKNTELTTMVNIFTRAITTQMKTEFKDDIARFLVKVKRSESSSAKYPWRALPGGKSVTDVVLVHLDIETGEVTLSLIFPNFDENTWWWDDINEIYFYDPMPSWELHPLTQGLKIVVPPDVNFLLNEFGGEFSTALDSVEI